MAPCQRLTENFSFLQVCPQFQKTFSGTSHLTGIPAILPSWKSTFAGVVMVSRPLFFLVTQCPISLETGLQNKPTGACELETQERAGDGLTSRHDEPPKTPL